MSPARSAWVGSVAVLGLFASRASALTPGTAPLASAVIAATQTGNGFHYNISLTDLGTSQENIGTFWYSWVPGQDYMATSPTNIVGPAGWTDIITGGGATDGFAIQWKNSSGSLIPVGGSATFSYDSLDTPTTEFGNSPFFPATPVGTSFVYEGAPFSDAGTKFVVAVPEPTTLLGASLALLLLKRRRVWER